ncbi:MAG: hypothetical protein ACOC54_06040, partial [Candidatus Sumerlaeota bacterium]
EILQKGQKHHFSGFRAAHPKSIIGNLLRRALSINKNRLLEKPLSLVIMNDEGSACFAPCRQDAGDTINERPNSHAFFRYIACFADCGYNSGGSGVERQKTHRPRIQ